MYRSLVLFILFIHGIHMDANVVLPSVFGDHMVIQQKSDVRFWGWAKPLEEVTIRPSWTDKVYKTTTGNSARWEIMIPTPEAGGPYTIDIHGYNQIRLEDVLLGEVWLCSGQSNMEWTANMGIDSAEESIREAIAPQIRLINIQHRSASGVQDDGITDGWQQCRPETMANFSSVGYFFARRLQQELNVPVGMINASWGGTPIEAWIAMDHCDNAEFVENTASQLVDVPWGPDQPGCIYHAMIAPFTALKIAGTLWYQGEANAESTGYNPWAYHELLPMMISSWRAAFQQDLPFYFVQIAPFMGYGGENGAIIRDAQRNALSIPNTGMVVTSDIGNIHDIHPANKKPVGERLAHIALKRHYRTLTSQDSGPLYAQHDMIAGAIVVRFDHAEGLHFRGDGPAYFEIASENGRFYKVRGEIQGDRVVLRSAEVKEPKFVRFAWSNAAEPNLFNGAGFPASCFTTRPER
jgi:sialate O-acetylesterase